MKKLTRCIVLPVLAIILLDLSSCCRTESCQNSGLSVQLRGFDSTDLDTLYVKHYTAHTGFTHLLNSEMTAGYSYNGRWDTVSLAYAATEQYDLEIEIPALGRVVRIDSLTFKHGTQQVCGISMDKAHPCISPVATYRMDATVITNPDPQQYSSYSAVINK